jgi:hypothetical protein
VLFNEVVRLGEQTEK